MDPFSIFLQKKIERFKSNTQCNLIKDRVEKTQIQPTKERAVIMSRPLDKNERKRLSQEQREDEDKRINKRTEAMSYDYIVKQIQELFAAD